MSDVAEEEEGDGVGENDFSFPCIYIYVERSLQKHKIQFSLYQLSIMALTHRSHHSTS
jgi:hypothetical protein